MSKAEMVTVMPEEMQERFTTILQRYGFTAEKADQCAAIFTGNSVDGVYTHGVNRFPRFVKYVKEGYIKPAATPTLKHKFGGIEQWDGNLGAGPLNAVHATENAMRLAAEHGIGCIALSNTNHWMRAGAYGRMAAEAGFVFIGWTNTIANMPAWGATDARLGNNPLVLAMPYENEPIVLDMAMSQYSLGAMELAVIKNEKLPINAGFTKDGKITDDPAAILASRRLIPSGYWKGSGLALLLDILSAVLSGGLSTHEISNKPAEYGLSQVFIAIDLSKLSNESSVAGVVRNIIDDYHASAKDENAKSINYPGERVMQSRKNNEVNGIPVMKKVWDLVMDICNGSNDLSTLPYT
jgi:3-dehydro-L-gulonate 2-dehydrogenase